MMEGTQAASRVEGRLRRKARLVETLHPIKVFRVYFTDLQALRKIKSQS